MARRVVLACAGLSLLLACGCSPYGGGEFACTSDTQCGAGGTCADGFCAFPDPTCDSDFRYGDLSGPLSGQCLGVDQGHDASIDSNLLPENCFGTGLVTACFDAAPTGTQTITMDTFVNTGTSELCTQTMNAVPACVIAAESIVVNSGVFLAGTGERPLVLVATGSITVEGSVDVGSYRQFNFVGAGSDMPGCNAGGAPTGTSGGAGGSFGGRGGNGAAVGSAGMAGDPLAPTVLRGGCSGQQGADNGAPTGGARGRGGGAVYLIAETSIAVNGAVRAGGSGAGGGATSASAGGGGGGSGGFIGFDTPSLAISGAVIANGGGGGEASGAQSTGDAGSDATSPTTAANGGSGGTSFGTDGGDGSFGSMLDGEAGAANCTSTCTTPSSGGGGGGGAGIIKLYRATSPSGGGTISPPPT